MVILLAVMTGSMVIPLSSQLCVRNQETGDVLLHFPAKPGDGFEVSYTHSQNRGNVRDLFQLDSNKTIVLQATCFTSYGAGMPEPESGQTFRYDEDGVWIEQLQREVDPYIFFVGTIADHQFHWLGNGKDLPRTYAMKTVTSPQTPIIVTVEKLSLYALIFSGLE